MPVVNNTYYSNPAPTNIIRIEARKSKDIADGLNIVINSQEFVPPHVNPRDYSLYVPTFENYNIRILTVDTPGGPGIVRSEYSEQPSLDVPVQFPPVEMLVGGGRDQDPVNGDGFKVIPGTGGLKPSQFIKLGIGPLPDDLWDWYEGVDGDGNAAVGIELLGDDDDGNPIVFIDGEQYVVEFQITLDGNASEAIVEIRNDLDAHIADVSNPHDVTKAQVGLGNIPNAKSDAINLNDSNTLATSKAVNDLRLSIVNSILYASTYNIGAVPGNSDQIYNIVHGYTATPFTQYQIQCTLYGVGANWNADNDCTIVMREQISGSFKITIRNLGGATANLRLNFVLIKNT